MNLELSVRAERICGELGIKEITDIIEADWIKIANHHGVGAMVLAELFSEFCRLLRGDAIKELENESKAREKYIKRREDDLILRSHCLAKVAAAYREYEKEYKKLRNKSKNKGL